MPSFPPQSNSTVPRPSNADWGWLLLAGYVAAYDTWALKTGRETLSSAFGRSLRHPIRRWPTLMTWGVITLHLFGRLPTWLDPLHHYGRMFRKSPSEVTPGRTVFLAEDLTPSSVQV